MHIDSRVTPGPDGKIRLYPGIEFFDAPLEPPYAVSMDVNFGGLSSSDRANLYVWDRGSYISLLDLFNTHAVPAGGFPAWHVFAMVRLTNQGGSTFPIITFLDKNGNGTDGSILKGGKPLRESSWSRVTLEVTTQDLLLYVDGVLASKVAGTGTTLWLHEGLYVGPWGKKGKLLASGTLLLDNVEVRK